MAKLVVGGGDPGGLAQHLHDTWWVKDGFWDQLQAKYWRLYIIAGALGVPLGSLLLKSAAPAAEPLLAKA